MALALHTRAENLSRRRAARRGGRRRRWCGRRLTPVLMGPRPAHVSDQVERSVREIVETEQGPDGQLPSERDLDGRPPIKHAKQEFARSVRSRRRVLVLCEHRMIS